MSNDSDGSASKGRRTSAAMQEFVASLETMSAAASRIAKLQRRTLISSLEQSGAPAAAARQVLDFMDDIGANFDHIRRGIAPKLQRSNGEPSASYSRDAFLALVKAGLLLPAGEFTARMNWTRQALSKALAANRVFFIEDQATRYYPAFYLDVRYERRHLEDTAKLLGDLPGGSKWQFFTSPKGSLGGLTPLDALLKGMLQQVKVAAEGFAQR